MKNIILLSSILSVLIVLSSCNKDDSLPADSTRMSEIAANRTRVGTNQKVLFACPVSLPAGATDVSIEWTTSDGRTVEQESYEAGISYQTFSWSNPGEYVVKCKVKYTYGSEGVKNAEKSYRIMVLKCHFLNSFMNDDVETVLSDNPNVDRSEDDEYEYIYKESDRITHIMSFYNDLLYYGVTIELKSKIESTGYIFFKQEVKKRESISTTGQCNAVLITNSDHPNLPTEEEEKVARKVHKGIPLLDEELALLNRCVDNGRIELRYNEVLEINFNTEEQIDLEIIVKSSEREDTYSCLTDVEVNSLFD